MNTVNLGRIMALVCTLALMSASWHSLANMSVTPENKNESRFLRTYDPMPLWTSFRVGCSSPVSTTFEFGALSGSRFPAAPSNVHYMRRIQPEICGNYQYRAVLTALHQNVISALGSAGCQVTSDELSTVQGVRIQYRCGPRTRGVITARLPQRQTGQSEGPFRLKLEMDEEWAVQRGA